MSQLARRTPAEAFGRYVLHEPIARGGMATVHSARVVGAQGFTRIVAAKRLHHELADDPELVAMFHDEARIASRIHHPNVVPVLDVVLDGDELILVQEYVHGVPLGYLAKRAIDRREPIPLMIVSTIIRGALSGLHAAHEVRDELGVPLHVVHRDVSPQNVLVSVDGTPRIVDFGIAKARTSSHHTREGLFKGKLSYMAPEQLCGEVVDRRADVYATGVLLWELLVNARYRDQDQGDIDFVYDVTSGRMPTVIEALAAQRSSIDPERWELLRAFDTLVQKALACRREDRFPTAAAMSAAIESVCEQASAQETAAWVQAVGDDFLARRERLLATDAESWRSIVRVEQTPTLPVSAAPRPTKPIPRRERSIVTSLSWMLVGGALMAVGFLAGTAISHRGTHPFAITAAP